MARKPTRLPPPPPDQDEQRPATPPSGDVKDKPGWMGVVTWIVFTAIGALLLLAVTSALKLPKAVPEQPYTAFLAGVRNDLVASVVIDSVTGSIDVTTKSGAMYTTRGPADALPEADVALLDAHGVEREYTS